MRFWLPVVSCVTCPSLPIVTVTRPFARTTPPALCERLTRRPRRGRAFGRDRDAHARLPAGCARSGHRRRPGPEAAGPSAFGVDAGVGAGARARGHVELEAVRAPGIPRGIRVSARSAPRGEHRAREARSGEAMDETHPSKSDRPGPTRLTRLRERPAGPGIASPTRGPPSAPDVLRAIACALDERGQVLAHAAASKGSHSRDASSAETSARSVSDGVGDVMSASVTCIMHVCLSHRGSAAQMRWSSSRTASTGTLGSTFRITPLTTSWADARPVLEWLLEEEGRREDEAPLVPEPDDDVGQVDILDHPELALDDDLVADADRLRDRELDAADDAAQRLLRREADDHAEDARRGEERDAHAADELELDHEERERHEPHRQPRDPAESVRVPHACARYIKASDLLAGLALPVDDRRDPRAPQQAAPARRRPMTNALHRHVLRKRS